MRMIAITILYLAMSGCASFDNSIANLANTLDNRGVRSCFAWDAYIEGRGIAGGRVRGITVTGGADIELCEDFWIGQIF